MGLDLQVTVDRGLKLILKNPKLMVIGLIFGLLTSIVYYIILGAYANANINMLGSLELVLYFQKFFISEVIKFLFSLLFYGMIIKLSYDLIRGGKKRTARTKSRSRKAGSRRKPSSSQESRIVWSSITDSISFVLKKYIIFLFAYVLSTFLVIGGLVLFVIPGIYLYFRLIFFPFAIIIDNESVMGSLKRSWRITRGNTLKLFLIWLVIVLLMVGVSFMVSFLTVFLPISPETVAQILVYTLQMPWITASLIYIYMKMRRGR
jgi:membrane-anchored glycerophosphoryl diester phosphodiesterase (GDPDase)